MYINMFAMAKKYFETQINVEQQSIHINMFTMAKKIKWNIQEDLYIIGRFCLSVCHEK